jgi:hydroxymethylglutaryl-CoA lyase
MTKLSIDHFVYGGHVTSRIEIVEVSPRDGLQNQPVMVSTAEVGEARIGEIAAQLAAMGVPEIAVADTIGVGDPVAVTRRLNVVRAAAPEARLRCHFHNTRNTGLANAYAAWAAGASALDASIGGIGGCPFAPAATGNIPTEDTVYMLHRMGVQTGYDLKPLLRTADWLAQRLGGAPLPAMLGRAGGFPGAL